MKVKHAYRDIIQRGQAGYSCSNCNGDIAIGDTHVQWSIHIWGKCWANGRTCLSCCNAETDKPIRPAEELPEAATVDGDGAGVSDETLF